MKIVKVQMPVDMDKARATGRMYIDHGKKPEMLVYALNSKAYVVRDEALWDRMANQPMRTELLNPGEEAKGSLKTFFFAEYTNGKWVIGDIAPWQEW
jgi:hypothetical protein